MEEIWKTILGYEGLYEISSYGNVRSLDRVVTRSDGNERFAKGKRLSKIKSNGYWRANLSRDGKVSPVGVHRLVAIAFLRNPEAKPQVNHIDEIRTNNHIGNLEWATAKENVNHGSGLQRMAATQAKSFMFRNPAGSVVFVRNLQAFCREIHPELQVSCMHGLVTGKCNIHKGWTVVSREELSA